MQVRRLNMYKKRPVRDAKGKVIHEVGDWSYRLFVRFNPSVRQWLAPLMQDFQSKELPNSRIQPDRRWFGNTRVVGQKQLEQFRQEMSAKVYCGLPVCPALPQLCCCLRVAADVLPLGCVMCCGHNLSEALLPTAELLQPSCSSTPTSRQPAMLQADDAYTVLLRERKLPLSLLEDPEAKKGAKAVRSNLLQVQPFQDTFGAKHRRKRPRLAADSYTDLLGKVEEGSVRCGVLCCVQVHAMLQQTACMQTRRDSGRYALVWCGASDPHCR